MPLTFVFVIQEQELNNELKEVDVELQREKNLSIELREQLSSLGGCLRGGADRAKSALLSELLSMQLFYTLQDMPEHERQQVAKEMQNEYLYSGDKLLEVRGKVLENTDNVLKLFESYLNLLNHSGKDLENSGLNLKDLEASFLNGERVDVGVVGPLNESNNSNSEEQRIPDSLQLASNKTDDDKVMDSGNNDEESNEFFTLTKDLRDKLSDIKESLDGDAIGFLKKAFALDDDDKDSGRKQVYNAMMEFLRQRECQEGMGIMMMIMVIRIVIMMLVMMMLGMMTYVDNGEGDLVVMMTIIRVISDDYNDNGDRHGSDIGIDIPVVMV